MVAYGRSSKTRKVTRSICTLVFVMMFWAAQAISDIVVVVHADNPMNNMDQEDIKRIFMGKLTRYADGSPIILGYQSAEKDLSQIFSQELTGRTMAKLSSYWAKRWFSGKMEAPNKFVDDKSLMHWLGKEKQGIGYIDSASLNEKVKVVLMIVLAGCGMDGTDSGSNPAIHKDRSASAGSESSVPVLEVAGLHQCNRPE